MLIRAYIATRSGHSVILLKVAVENHTVKHLCRSLFFNRITGLRYKGLLKCDSCLVFSCGF